VSTQADHPSSCRGPTSVDLSSVSALGVVARYTAHASRECRLQWRSLSLPALLVRGIYEARAL
jgi:hypothetical protein